MSSLETHKTADAWDIVRKVTGLPGLVPNVQLQASQRAEILRLLPMHGVAITPEELAAGLDKKTNTVGHIIKHICSTLEARGQEKPLEERAPVDAADIERRVRNAIIESLNVETEDVTPDANLMEDLGAESIDYLDIAFRLEREFHVKLQHRQFLEIMNSYDEDNSGIPHVNRSRPNTAERLEQIIRQQRLRQAAEKASQ